MMETFKKTMETKTTYQRFLAVLVLTVVAAFSHYIRYISNYEFLPLDENHRHVHSKTTQTTTIETTTTTEITDWNWWEQHVEDLAVVYQPSNNTNWCTSPPSLPFLSKKKAMMGFNNFNVNYNFNNNNNNNDDDDNDNDNNNNNDDVNNNADDDVNNDEDDDNYNNNASDEISSRHRRHRRLQGHLSNTGTQKEAMQKRLGNGKRNNGFKNNNNGNQLASTRYANIQQEPKNGIYLVKTVKAGSSTAAAVTVQIAQSVAEQQQRNFPYCHHHVQHGFTYTYRQNPHFLWTSIRHPAKRTISQYFFAKISRYQQKYNSTNLVGYLREHKNFQLHYIGMYPGTQSLQYSLHSATKEQVLEMIQNVVNMYHMIAITERMDESLVVMKLLYGFTDESMIVLNSKQAGGLDDGKYKNRCHVIQKSYTTPDVDEYIDKGFRDQNYDYLLYAVANRSLDKTIEQVIGKERFQQELQKHLELTKIAEDQCADKAIYPCTKDGAVPKPASMTNCFFGDVGCGHDCVQQTLQNYLMKNNSTTAATAK